MWSKKNPSVPISNDRIHILSDINYTIIKKKHKSFYREYRTTTAAQNNCTVYNTIPFTVCHLSSCQYKMTKTQMLIYLKISQLNN